MPGTLVLLSGGQDSATALYWAAREIDENNSVLENPLHTLTIYYGQRHADEVECAQWLAIDIGATHHFLDMATMMKSLNAKSALMQRKTDTAAPSEFNAELPASFVPGRNIFFLTAAAVIASWNDCNDVVAGMCQTDYSGYPDCRQAFISQMEGAICQALDRDIELHTPIMNITKAETWKLANELGVVSKIIEHTLTDYNGDKTPNDWGMGKEDNPASIIRAKGYREAKEQGWV